MKKALLYFTILFLNSTVVLAASDDFLVAQKKAIEAIEKYVATSDWHIRQDIMNATGYSETVASRIFRGFNVLRTNAKPCDESAIVEAASEEINRNPRYTLYVLEPVLREKMTEADEAKYSGSSYPPVWPDNIDLFFNICVDFALSHDGEFAAKKLEALSKDDDKSIAKKAKKYFDFYQSEKSSTSKALKGSGVKERSKCFKKWLW